MSLGSEMPKAVGGRYRPIRIIGQGGMGAVYEVEHLHTGQRLALKVLLARLGMSADAVERFQREARASSRIQSDHVVRVVDADRAPELEGAPFLVMELLDGQDLEQLAKDKLAPADVVEWLRQIARALTKAHALGIVHRDLKPENLFLTRRDDGSPCVKILDFGIAKISEQGMPSTQAGHILGTPLFMAPEQAGGVGAKVTPRTDLFSLGLVAFRLLVGRSYWTEGNVVMLITQLTIQPMEAPSLRGSTFGPKFDAWFSKACNRDPEQRFASVNEQVEALANALGLPTQVALSDSAADRAAVIAELASAPTLDALAESNPGHSNQPSPDALPAIGVAETIPAENEAGGASLNASASAITSTPRGRSRWWLAGGAVAVIAIGGFAIPRLGGNESAPPRVDVVASSASVAAPSASAVPRANDSVVTMPAVSSSSAAPVASGGSGVGGLASAPSAHPAKLKTVSVAASAAPSAKPSATAKPGPLDDQH